MSQSRLQCALGIKSPQTPPDFASSSTPQNETGPTAPYPSPARNSFAGPSRSPVPVAKGRDKPPGPSGDMRSPAVASDIDLPSQHSISPSRPISPSHSPAMGPPSNDNDSSAPTSPDTEKNPRSRPPSKRRRTDLVLFKHKLFSLPFSLPKLNVVLENSGSVARDHLASERTFLAYMRTSLALASTGVALVQLFSIVDLTQDFPATGSDNPARRLKKFAKPLGVLLIFFSLLVTYVGFHRYFLTQRELPKGNFSPAKIVPVFIAFVLGAFITVIFGVLVSVH